MIAWRENHLGEKLGEQFVGTRKRGIRSKRMNDQSGGGSPCRLKRYAGFSSLPLSINRPTNAISRGYFDFEKFFSRRCFLLSFLKQRIEDNLSPPLPPPPQCRCGFSSVYRKSILEKRLFRKLGRREIWFFFCDSFARNRLENDFSEEEEGDGEIGGER